MIKKITTLLLAIAMVFTIQLSQPKQAYAVDADDPQNTTNWITNVLNTGESIWGTLSQEVLEPAVKSLAQKMLDKMTKSVLSWANGGFDGDPSFINNWDDFLKGTEHEILSSAFNNAVDQVNIAQQGLGGDYSGDVGDMAQQNYELWQSGEISTARAIAGTVANFGSQQLNQDVLGSVIAGSGETLTTILGSQGAKDQFYNGNITDVGENDALKIYTAYIAATDKPNSTSGLNTLVGQTLGAETENKVNSVIDNLQTPQKFLDKQECSDGSEVENGECTGGGRLISTTPGTQVGELVTNSLFKETDFAQNADGLIGSLVSALGQMTAGLIDGGLSKISNTAVETFYDSDQADTFSGQNEFSSGDYQSNYDVLGIESNSNYNPNNTPGNINDLFTPQEGEPPFLGGPEDTNSYWGLSPQIIINFNEVLERNMNMAEEELGYYKEMEQIVIDTKDVAIKLDQCVPGPDYGWEGRWKDIMGSTGDENALGLAKTKQMSTDPKVNVPGSRTMINTFKDLAANTRSEAARIQLRLEQLDSVISTLDFIQSETRARFNLQKQDYNENLVLFYEDWAGEDGEGGLTTEQKESALGFAVENEYYILKPEEGETIQSAIVDSPNKARNAVLKASWDIWRELTPQEEKNDLRYSFFILQTRLSSEQFIATAKAKLAQVRGASINTQKLVSDCLIFKAYVLGTPISELQSLSSNAFADATEIGQAEALQNQIEDLTYNVSEAAGAFFLGGPLGEAIGGAVGTLLGFGGGGDLPPPYTYIEITNPPTDEEIIDFLAEQDILAMTNDESALFQTREITRAGAISQSILGFESEADKRLYFLERYPDIGPNMAIGSPLIMEIDEETGEMLGISNGNSGGMFGDQVGYPALTRTNAYSIYEIFRQDDYYVWIFGGDDDPNITGQFGTLFCQHNGAFGTGATDGGLFGAGGLDHVNHSKCVKGNWYKASFLDYELVFAGVNG